MNIMKLLNLKLKYPIELQLDEEEQAETIEKEDINQIEEERLKKISIIDLNEKDLNLFDFLEYFCDEYTEKYYPELMKVINIFISMPFSTVECERSFSIVSRIKTKFRNKINNNNYLQLCY